MDLTSQKFQRMLIGSAFALPICLMLLVYLGLGFRPWGETSPHSGDFLLQYLPIYLSMRRLVQTGDWAGLYYSFSKSLGGAMPAVYGFNGLGLKTLTLIWLPQAWIQGGLYWLNLLSYGLTSLSMVYYLLKSPLQKEPLGLFGYLASGLAYSLSGFALAQAINPNFMDLLPLLPLVVLFLERSLLGERRVLFPLSLALAYVIHFYTAYMMTLFLGLYGLWLILTWPNLLGKQGKVLLRFVGQMILGLGLAAGWLLPILANLWQSKGAQGSLFVLSWQSLNDWLDYFAKLFVGSFGQEEWGDARSLPQIFVSIVFVISSLGFFLNRKLSSSFRLGAGVVSLILLASFHWYFLDLIWHMGRRPVGFYFRNAWLFNFWLVRLGSFAPLQIPSRFWTRGLSLFGVLFLILSALLSLPEVTWWQKLLTASIWLAYLVWTRLGSQGWAKGMLGILCLELVLNATIGLSKSPYQVSNQSIQTWLSYEETSLSPSSIGRSTFQGRLSKANRPLVSGEYGLSHFSSSLEVDLIQGLGNLGMATSTAVTNYTGPNPILDDLFAVQSIQLAKVSSYWQDLTQGFYDMEGDLSLSLQGSPLLMRKVSNSAVNKLATLEDNLIDNYQSLLDLLYKTGIQFETVKLLPEGSNLLIQDSQAKVIKQAEPVQLSWTLQLGEGDLVFLRLPQSWRNGLEANSIQVNGQEIPFEPRFQDDLFLWIGNGKQMGVLNLDLSLYNLTSLEDLDQVLYRVDGQALKEAMETNQVTNASLEVKTWNNHQLIARLDGGEGGESALIAIPYSSAWKIKVNGQVRASQSSLSGLATSIALDPGINLIEMNYQAPGLVLGAMISLASLVILTLSSQFPSERKNQLPLHHRIRLSD